MVLLKVSWAAGCLCLNKLVIATPCDYIKHGIEAIFSQEFFKHSGQLFIDYIGNKIFEEETACTIQHNKKRFEKDPDLGCYKQAGGSPHYTVGRDSHDL